MKTQYFATKEGLKTRTLTLKDVISGTDFTEFHDIERINFVCDDETWLDDLKFDENIRQIASHCNSLSLLDLTGFYESTIKSFGPLLKLSTSLICDICTVNGWEALNDSSIVVVTINEPWLDGDGILSAERALTRLKSLEVRHEMFAECPYSRGGIDDEIVENLLNLEEMSLKSETSLDTIGKYCRYLKKLYVAQETNLTSGNFEKELQALVEGCIYLEELEIDWSTCGCYSLHDIRLDGLDFSSFRNLKILALNGSIGNRERNRDVNWETMFRLGTQCRFLEELGLSKVTLDHESLMKEIRSTKGNDYVLFPMLKSISWCSLNIVSDISCIASFLKKHMPLTSITCQCKQCR